MLVRAFNGVEDVGTKLDSTCRWGRHSKSKHAVFCHMDRAQHVTDRFDYVFLLLGDKALFRSPEVDDMDNLPHVRCVVSEALRWLPVSPVRECKVVLTHHHRILSILSGA